MHISRAIRRRPGLVTSLIAAGFMLGAVGCGGDDDSSSEQDPTIDEPSVNNDDADTASADGADASPEGFCITVISVDLSAAFDGQLEFGEANDYTGREMCTVPLEGAEGEGLVVKITTAESYEVKTGYEDEGLPFKEIDSLGEEAFILNEADLNVLLDDGTALEVALQGFWIVGSPPDPAVVEAGLVEVAEAIIASR